VPLPTFPGLADEKKSIAEDISIVERMQVGRRSPAMTGGVFSPALEDTTHSFQKTFVMRLQAAGVVG
jgi:phenylpropionate dioxygenase-like ring-hydroxylating dioxygenase large terminal subunit